VAAELDDARPRYLHRDPAHNYTHEPWRSVLDEPECVTASEQRRISLEARRRERDRLRAEWQPVLASLDRFLALTLPRPVAHRALSVAKLAKSVEREIGAR
jgi:hypothetical protein